MELLTDREEAREAGHVHYQGKICKRDHDGIRYVVSNICVICMKDATKKHYDKNPYVDRTPEQKQKIVEQTEKWRLTHLDDIAEYQKEYHNTYAKTEEGIAARRAASQRYEAKLKLIRNQNESNT